jgi:hypothetical protein
MSRLARLLLGCLCAPAARLLPWCLLYLLAALRGASDACCAGTGLVGLWISAAAFALLITIALRQGARSAGVLGAANLSLGAKSPETPDVLLALAQWTPLALYLVIAR